MALTDFDGLRTSIWTVGVANWTWTRAHLPTSLSIRKVHNGLVGALCGPDRFAWPPYKYLDGWCGKLDLEDRPSVDQK